MIQVSLTKRDIKILNACIDTYTSRHEVQAELNALRSVIVGQQMVGEGANPKKVSKLIFADLERGKTKAAKKQSSEKERLIGLKNKIQSVQI